MADKLSMIFTEEQMSRITFVTEYSIMVDVHGLNRRQMWMLIRNLSAMYHSAVEITVIHGYSHGTSLKESLWEKEKELSRIYRMESCQENPGRTVLYLR